MGLKRKSVIEEVGDGTRRIGMHDLWREFAVMETKIWNRERHRWVYDVVDSSSLRTEEGGVVGARFGGGWVKLQRICMMRTDRRWQDMEAVRGRCMDDRNEMNRVHRLRDMRILKSCIFLCPMRSRSTPVSERLIFVDEVDFRSCSNVIVLKLVRPKLKVLDLSALQNLRSLEYGFGDTLNLNRVPLPRVEVRGLGGLSNLVTEQFFL